MKNRDKAWVFMLGILLSIISLAVLLQDQGSPARKDMPLTAQRAPVVELSKEDMVNLQDYIPGIQIDLIYATKYNIYGRQIYDSDVAWLRRGTADKLKAAQEEFRQLGYRLKIWDAYRPPQAQYKLWEVMPDRRYVVNPNEGFSYHSRGVAVDLTLVNKDGEEVFMPTGFDDLTQRAHRDYTGLDPLIVENVKLLERIMVKHGFLSIYHEWWHFADSERDQYGVVDESMIANSKKAAPYESRE